MDAPSDDFAAPLSKQVALQGALGQALKRAASTIVQGQPAVQLRKRARFYHSVRASMEDAIGALHADGKGEAAAWPSVGGRIAAGRFT